MCYVILFLILIVIIIKSDAGEISAKDNPHIIFTSSSSSQQEQALHYTVVANKPLHLHFQNMSRGWCLDPYKYNHKYDKLGLPTMKHSTYSFTNVTYEMSALWKCVTEKENKKLIKPKYHEFYLNLHVKGAKSVEITVNGKKLTFNEADLSDPYDGYTFYIYEDGEHVQIVCRNPHITGSVHLEYHTKDAINISYSATFLIQLHSGSNSSYIDCMYNTTEPADTYIYRVTFVTKKRLFYLNESHVYKNISANQDKNNETSLPILGSSIGAVLIILGLTGAACWYVRTRNAKHIKTPYADLSNPNGSSIPQCTNEFENQYDACHYSENLSNRGTYHETPESIENNMDPEYHYYTKIDYLSCKPKIGETQTRNSKVYDEPYVHITMLDGMQALQQD